MKEKAMKRFSSAWAIGLFLIFTVFLYGPLSLYLPNSQELWFHIDLVLKIALPISIGLWILLVGIAVLLPDKISNVYRKLLFGVTLGLYLQGNYINISYGSAVMDGTGIDWSQYTGYAIIDTIAWIICLALPWIVDILFAKVEKLKSIKEVDAAKVLVYASLFFTAIQVPALISQATKYVPSAQGDYEITTNGIYELDDETNILFFVVDTLDEEYYEDFIAAHPEYTDNLGGFTHYANTMTAGGRTMLAIPAMLTGDPFKRQNTYTDYLATVWNQPNVLASLHDQGMDVRVYSETTYFNNAVAPAVENFESDSNTTAVSLQVLGKKLYKMTLYKFVPHLAKRYFLMSTSEFEEARTTVSNESDGNLYKVDDVTFYDNYEAEGFTVNSAYNGAFRMYHLHGAHSAYNMGADGNAKKDSTVEEQVAGNFFCINEMLEELKEKGLYDSATIVIAADHGENGKAQWPTLLVKEAGKTASDAYEDSMAPASLFDLPILFTEVAGTKLPNQEYGMRLQDLKEDMLRERHYFHNSSNSSRVVVNEYIANDIVTSNNKTITLVNQFEDPNGANTPYTLGTELSFSTDATANRYTTEGFSTNSGFSTKLHGPYATMSIPLSEMPKSEQLQAHIDIASSYIKGRHIIIYANDVAVYDATVDNDVISSGLIFDIPASVLNEKDKTLNLKFAFPEIDESEMEVAVSKRTRVAAFISLTIEEK